MSSRGLRTNGAIAIGAGGGGYASINS
jgi:hypothetical protein